MCGTSNLIVLELFRLHSFIQRFLFKVQRFSVLILISHLNIRNMFHKFRGHKGINLWSNWFQFLRPRRFFAKELKIVSAVFMPIHCGLKWSVGHIFSSHRTGGHSLNTKLVLAEWNDANVMHELGNAKDSSSDLKTLFYTRM